RAGRRDELEGQVPAERVRVEVAQFARIRQSLALGREPQHPRGRGTVTERAAPATSHPGRWLPDEAGQAFVAGAAPQRPSGPGWPPTRGKPLAPTRRPNAVTRIWCLPASCGATLTDVIIRHGINAVVERLDAELVPGAEQLTRPAVPDGEREHAAELMYNLLADPGVGLEQDLGIAARSEHHALLAQLRTQFHIVVN